LGSIEGGGVAGAADRWLAGGGVDEGEVGRQHVGQDDVIGGVGAEVSHGDGVGQQLARQRRVGRVRLGDGHVGRRGCRGGVDGGGGGGLVVGRVGVAGGGGGSGRVGQRAGRRGRAGDRHRGRGAAVHRAQVGDD